MDHRDVLKTIPAPERAALQERSDAAGLTHLALYLGALAVTGTWITAGAPLWWAALLPHGILLVFLFTLQHECTHDTPFANRWLNRIVGHLSGLVLLQPFTWFRHFHLAHHRHTNDPEHDPELAEGPRPGTRAAWLWHVSGLPAWRGWLTGVIQQAIAPRPAPYLPERALLKMRREARLMLAAYVLLFALFGWSLVWLWALPMLLGQPVLRLYLLAEHGRCPAVTDMLSNTRTTFTNRLVRFLAWNMPYHIEHHSAPNVPFHKLPELHKRMAPHLKSTSPSYSAFTRDYVAELE